MTAAAYINREGGTRSEACLRLSYLLLEWVMDNALSIRALHIPGKDNVAVDIMSRGGPNNGEWSLHPLIAEWLWERFGEAQADLFASKNNTKCRLWFSLLPSDAPPLGVDALGEAPWPRALLYAFPPLERLGEVVDRVRFTRALMILVAPYNPGSLWFPSMVSMAQGPCLPIPDWSDALTQAGGILRRRPQLRGCPLVAWLLSGPGC